MQKITDVLKGRRMLLAGAAGLALTVVAFASLLAGTGTSEASDGANAQVARLYMLQSAFHEAATAPDPAGSVTVEERIEDVLELFADDASLTFAGVTYSGKGSCAPGSLCDFFTNVAGPYQPGNRWVSLAPSFDTSFEIHGNTADVHFECHFFDEDWNETAHLAVTATARKVHGQWVFSEFEASPAGVPYPG